MVALVKGSGGERFLTAKNRQVRSSHAYPIETFRNQIRISSTPQHPVHAASSPSLPFPSPLESKKEEGHIRSSFLFVTDSNFLFSIFYHPFSDEVVVM